MLCIGLYRETIFQKPLGLESWYLVYTSSNRSQPNLFKLWPLEFFLKRPRLEDYMFYILGLLKETKNIFLCYTTNCTDSRALVYSMT